MNLKGTLDSIRKIMWQDTGLNGDAQRIEQLGWMLFLKIFSDKDKELEVLNDDYQSPIPKELHWDAWAADDEGITGDELVEFVDRKLFSTLRNLTVINSDDIANKRAALVREVFEGNNSPDTKKQFYIDKLKEELVDMAAEHMEFYKLMNKPELFATWSYIGRWVFEGDEEVIILRYENDRRY